MSLRVRRADGDKGGGHRGPSDQRMRVQEKAKAGYKGFFRGLSLHLSLSSHDKGQAQTKAEVRSGSVTSSWPDRPS